MQTIVHGIDLVDFARIEQMCQRHGKRFEERIFTDKERQYARSNRGNATEKLAGRFAAKEAVMKLLGTGWRGKICWRDIEVTNNALGKPEVSLSGQVRQLARQMHLGQVSVSITHTANFAIASAIALAGK